MGNAPPDAAFGPDYYRTVFHIPPEIPYQPTQIGLGLGMTQGFGIGLIVGLVIVVTVAWYNVRTSSLLVQEHQLASTGS